MAMNDTLKREIKAAYKKHNLDRPFLVAIDGLGGAGKTTLVNQLINIIDNVVIIHIDDHIVERGLRYNTGHDEWFEYYQLQWDTISLKESLFEKLHQNGKQLRLSFYINVNINMYIFARLRMYKITRLLLNDFSVGMILRRL
ncbi:MAG: uridine kinase [Solibacillus sp.]